MDEDIEQILEKLQAELDFPVLLAIIDDFAGDVDDWRRIVYET